MKLALPDCRGHADVFTLSAADRRELVRRIAEKGVGEIDAFIAEREAQGDSLIARKVRKLREELMRRAEELRQRLRDGFAEREAQVEAEYRAKLAELQSRREDLEGNLDRLRADDPSVLAAALRRN
ncbi:MAG TPA: hypothetical protein VHH36_05640, partial [Candidatus Thermoplasmatota archaeon]|nr:hypothetical protein [Candidatus Thermoplasmatota archaeon]